MMMYVLSKWVYVLHCMGKTRVKCWATLMTVLNNVKLKRVIGQCTHTLCTMYHSTEALAKQSEKHFQLSTCYTNSKISPT